MPREVIIHIGPHKTGTTTLQNAFHRHREKLAAHGICYPKSGAIWAGKSDVVWAGQHNIAWQFWTDDRITSTQNQFDARAGRLEDALDECDRKRLDRLLLSSEDFSVIAGAGLEALAAALNGIERVRIIMYARSQAEWLQSNYVNLVGVGISATFDDWIAPFLETEGGRLDFHGLAERWAAVDSQRRPEVAIFEDVVQGPGLLADFLSRLSVPETAIPPEASSNQSVSADVVVAQRVFSATFGKALGLERRRECLRLIHSHAVERGWDGGRAWFIGPSLVRELERRYAGGNRRLCATYVGQDAVLPVSRTITPLTSQTEVSVPLDEIFGLFRRLVDQGYLGSTR